MIVGVLQFDFAIPDAFTLKDKRQSVRSIKDRIANGFNVSVAEVGALDEHRRCVLGVAMVSNDKAHVEGALNKVLDLVRQSPAVELLDHQVDFL